VNECNVNARVLGIDSSNCPTTLLLFIVQQFIDFIDKQPMDRWQTCTEAGGTVAYPAAQDDSSMAVCIGVPKFVAGLSWPVAGM